MGEMGNWGFLVGLQPETEYLPPPSGDQKQGSRSSTSRPPQRNQNSLLNLRAGHLICGFRPVCSQLFLQ